MSTLDHILATELTPKKPRPPKKGETWIAVKDNPVTDKEDLIAFGTWEVGDSGHLQYVGNKTVQLFLGSGSDLQAPGDKGYVVVNKKIFFKTWRRK